MFEDLNFPLRQKMTVVPSGFRCYMLKIVNRNYKGMDQLPCRNVISVDSPAGWGITRFPDEEPDHVDLYIVNSGEIKYISSDNELTVTAGQSLLIPSWIPRKVFTTREGNHIYIRVEMPQKRYGFKKAIQRESLNAEAINFFTRSLLVENNESTDELIYRQYLAECLAIAIRREIFSTSSINSPDQAQKLLHALQNADSSMLTVQNAAKLAGMSVSALRSFCLENFGKTPGKLIEEMLMARARGMLSYGTMSIDEIAENLGYADRFVFSKAFTRNNKISPAAFRKMQW